jgi:hypothetical protein
MRSLDLEQFWLTPTDHSRGNTDSAAATAETLENPFNVSPRDSGLLPSWASAMISDADVPDIPKRAYVRCLIEAARIHSEAIATLRAFDHRAAVWLSLGFVSGMIAWHAVGFWSFVSEAVLHPSAQDAGIAALAPARSYSGGDTSIVTGSLPTFRPRAGTCMALTIDRGNGITSAAPCIDDNQSLRDAGRRRRADRLTSIENRLDDKTTWATATERAPDLTPATPAPEPPSPDHPTAADFDLTLPAAN